MRIWLFAVLLLFLAACAPQMADSEQPTITPSPTLTPAPTPTPLPHPAAFDAAFERGIIRYDAARDQWLVSAVQTADGGQQTIDLALLPDSFTTNDELRQHNPLAPYTLRALPLTPAPLPQGEGVGVRVLYNPSTAEFRLAPNFQELYTGVNTDAPQLNQFNVNSA